MEINNSSTVLNTLQQMQQTAHSSNQTAERNTSPPDSQQLDSSVVSLSEEARHKQEQDGVYQPNSNAKNPSRPK